MGDVDAVVAKWVNGFRPAIPFFRLAQGLYLFGRKQVVCKIVNDKPVFRVGGGFIGFDKLLELHAAEEFERLLNYEMHQASGRPVFAKAQLVCRAMEESGFLDSLREQAKQTHPNHGPSKTMSNGPRRQERRLQRHRSME